MLMVATHVVPNVSINIERAAESLSCGHQVANDALRAAMDETASPIYGLLLIDWWVMSNKFLCHDPDLEDQGPKICQPNKLIILII